MVDLPDQRFHAVIGHRNAVGVERAGFQNVGAGGEILTVDFANDFRLGQQQQIVIALQIARPVGEARAAIIGFGQAVALDHGAHRAIQNQDTFSGQGEEFSGTI
jgi:hypothetical protein